MNSNLVFDIGMHNGNDSAHYLSRGYRVVAVEANPELCAAAGDRFEKEIKEGKFIIENVAISPQPGVCTFYINEVQTEFSAIDEEVASRGSGHTRKVEVPGADMARLFKKHGVPFFMKVDIERADIYCIQGLTPGDLPQYVSIEAHGLEYLMTLWGLGYRKFRVVDQMKHNVVRKISNEALHRRLHRDFFWYWDRLWAKMRANGFPRGSSGPMPHECSQPWKSIEEVSYDWLHVYFKKPNRGTLEHRSWFDFQASL